MHVIVINTTDCIIVVFSLECYHIPITIREIEVMKQLSLQLLANTVSAQRKAKKMRQVDLSKATGINRSILSLIENEEFTPSVNQLKALADVLDFVMDSLFTDPGKKLPKETQKYNIVAGGATGAV